MPQIEFDLSRNLLITAGPGTGKSTMLADMAAQMLTGGTVQSPRKILALSFKRNAANDLNKKLCSRLSAGQFARTESRTFDDFAREIVDRFSHLLPECWRFNGHCYIDDQLFDPFTLQPKIYAAAGDHFDAGELSEIPLPDFCYSVMTPDILPESIFFNGEISHDLKFHMWQFFLSDFPARLDFPMVCALAELILRTNRSLRNALRITYGAVLLDEFQDITQCHYNLLKTAFSDTRIIAAGDKNQSIMRWAHAMPDAFERLQNDFNAGKISLNRSFRSAPLLLKMQNQLAARLGNNDPLMISADPKRHLGECEAMLFASDLDEGAFLVEKAAQSNVSQLRDFCVIVRDLPAAYLPLWNYCAMNCDFRFRDESLLQKILSEPVTGLLLDLWENIIGDFDQYKYEKIVSHFAFTDGLPEEKTAEMLADFVYSLPPLDGNEKYSGEQLDILMHKSIDFLGISRLKNRFGRYRKGNFLEICLKDLARLLTDDPFAPTATAAKIWDFRHGRFIPVTTIQQCKAFETHTVFFTGWEDPDFPETETAGEEEMCGLLIASSRAKEKLYFSAALERMDTPMEISRIQHLYSALQEISIIPQMIRRTE